MPSHSASRARCVVCKREQEAQGPHGMAYVRCVCGGPLRAISNRVPCEVCGGPMHGFWGWDDTPLCRDHFFEAERRIMAIEKAHEAEVLSAVKESRDA